MLKIGDVPDGLYFTKWLVYKTVLRKKLPVLDGRSISKAVAASRQTALTIPFPFVGSAIYFSIATPTSSTTMYF